MQVVGERLGPVPHHPQQLFRCPVAPEESDLSMGRGGGFPGLPLAFLMCEMEMVVAPTW